MLSSRIFNKDVQLSVQFYILHNSIFYIVVLIIPRISFLYQQPSCLSALLVCFKLFLAQQLFDYFSLAISLWQDYNCFQAQLFSGSSVLMIFRGKKKNNQTQPTTQTLSHCNLPSLPLRDLAKSLFNRLKKPRYH